MRKAGITLMMLISMLPRFLLTADVGLHECFTALDEEIYAYVAEGDSDTRSMTIADTGCTDNVAGRTWLEDVEKKLAEYGLKPLKKPQNKTFRGLGGVIKTSDTLWEVPAGVFKNHTIVHFSEIGGKMRGLLSKTQLKAWGAVLNLAMNLTTFLNLGVKDVELPMLPGQEHALVELCDYDVESMDVDKIFKDFWLEDFVSERNKKAKVVEDVSEAMFMQMKDPPEKTAVLKAIENGTWHKSMPGRVRREATHTVQEAMLTLECLQNDTGKTLLWEFFSRGGATTRVAVSGGHVAGQPCDVVFDIDIADAKTQDDIVEKLEVFKPYLVTVAFPCDPWTSILRWLLSKKDSIARLWKRQEEHLPFLVFAGRVLRAQAEGGRLGLAENPLTADSWPQQPFQDLIRERLYELVHGDQCRWDLRSWFTQLLNKKATGFLVPANSVLAVNLNKLCLRDHEHQQLLGKQNTTPAGVWTLPLGREIVSSAVQQLAGDQKEIFEVAQRWAQKEHGTVVHGKDAEKVMDALYLRKGVTTVVTADPRKQIKVGRESVRHIKMVYDKDGLLIDFKDEWKRDAEKDRQWHAEVSRSKNAEELLDMTVPSGRQLEAVNEGEATVMHTDTALHVIVAETRKPEQFPATRMALVAGEQMDLETDEEDVKEMFPAKEVKKQTKKEDPLKGMRKELRKVQKESQQQNQSSSSASTTAESGPATETEGGVSTEPEAETPGPASEVPAEVGSDGRPRPKLGRPAGVQNKTPDERIRDAIRKEATRAGGRRVGRREVRIPKEIAQEELREALEKQYKFNKQFDEIAEEYLNCTEEELKKLKDDGKITVEQMERLIKARSELTAEELEFIKMRNAIVEEEAPDVERLRQKHAARWIDGARAVDIGPRPRWVTRSSWNCLRNLHWKLCHPSCTQLQRMLKRWGARTEMVEACAWIQCSVCDSLTRPSTMHKASAKEKKEGMQFNDYIYADEFEVTLSDDSVQLLMRFRDKGSALGITAPMEGHKIGTAAATEEVVERAWINWAGPPHVLGWDPHKVHESERMHKCCRRHGIHSDLTPAEAHEFLGEIDNSIDAFKYAFARVNEEMGLTKEDDPWIWTAKINGALNSQTRKAGYSPFQIVFGRDLRVPTSLLGDDTSLAAQSEAVFDSVARRAEGIRQAAAVAVRNIDSIDNISAAIHSRPQREQLFAVGNWLYYWRDAGSEKSSKELQPATGWIGPALCLAHLSPVKFLMVFDGDLIVVPQRMLRHATEEELRMIRNMPEMLKVLEEDFLRKAKLGFIDMSVGADDAEDKSIAEKRAAEAAAVPKALPKRARVQVQQEEQQGEAQQPEEQATEDPGAAPVREPTPTPMPTSMPAPTTTSSATSVGGNTTRGRATHRSRSPAVARAQGELRQARDFVERNKRPRSTGMEEPEATMQSGGASGSSAAAGPQRSRSRDRDRMEEIRQMIERAEEQTERGSLRPRDQEDDEGSAERLHKTQRQEEDDEMLVVETLNSTKEIWALIAEEAVQNEKCVLPKWPDDKVMEFEVFLASRQENRLQRWLDEHDEFSVEYISPSEHRKKAKGHEIPRSRIPVDEKPFFDKAEKDEWTKWVKLGAARALTKEERKEYDELVMLGTDNTMDFRMVLTDKAQQQRGNRSKIEVPIVAKARGVVPGYNDKDAWEGLLQTYSATMPDDCMHFLLCVSVAFGWDLIQADVDSAFLRGRKLNRRLYMRVPRQGLPATEWTPFFPGGTILIILVAVFGLNDAPFEFSQVHIDGFISTGAIQSVISPVVFYWFDVKRANPFGKPLLMGMGGAHVDDDLLTGDNKWKSTVWPQLQKINVYGKITQNILVQTGREITNHVGKVIVLRQKQYAESLKRIQLPPERRKVPEAETNDSEKGAMRAVHGKVAWLAKHSNPTLYPGLARSQQILVNSTVEDVNKLNSVVTQAVRDAELEMKFFPLKFWDPRLAVWNIADSGLMNAAPELVKYDLDEEAIKVALGTQAGFFVTLGVDDDSGKVDPMNFVAQNSHKLKRKVRSSSAGETMANGEGAEAADLVRVMVTEVRHGGKLSMRYEREEANKIPLIGVTDARDLFDNYHKRGKRPAEARLLLDLEAMREVPNYEMRWTSTKQMIADPLTKENVDLYLRYVMKTGEWWWKQDPQLDEKLAMMKAEVSRMRNKMMTERRELRETPKSRVKETSLAKTKIKAKAKAGLVAVMEKLEDQSEDMVAAAFLAVAVTVSASGGVCIGATCCRGTTSTSRGTSLASSDSEVLGRDGEETVREGHAQLRNRNKPQVKRTLHETECKHNDWNLKGSNKYHLKVTCNLCSTVLASRQKSVRERTIDMKAMSLHELLNPVEVKTEVKEEKDDVVIKCENVVKPNPVQAVQGTFVKAGSSAPSAPSHHRFVKVEEDLLPIISAQFEQTCQICTGRVSKGDDVGKHRRYGWAHGACLYGACLAESDGGMSTRA